MKTRSEAKAAKAEAPAETKPEVAVSTEVPEDPFHFTSANAAKKSKIRDDFDKIVKKSFVTDLHDTWSTLQMGLKIGEKRSEHGTLQKALDEAEDNAHLAHRVYITATIERERWERENDTRWGAMWSEATKSLQSEKENGVRAKQVTDADVRARVATLYPDDYVEIEIRRAKIKATVELLQDLSVQWKSRCRTLNVMKGSLRG